MKIRKRWLAALCATALTLGAFAVGTSQTALAAGAQQPAAGIETLSESGVQFDRVSLEIGATSSERNFNWLSTSDLEGYVQVALMPENWADGSEFPADADFVANVQAERDGSEREGWSSYKATVGGLEGNTAYIYRVGNGTNWSAAYGFETGNLGDGESFSFMFAGDPQIGASGDAASDAEGWTNTLDTMMAAFPETDFMISLGDQINASNPETVESEYEGYFAPEALHGITMATNVGNHEAGANNQHYSYNYNMPNRSAWGAVDSTGAASGDYWFNYNGVLFMSLNSNEQNTAVHKAFLEEAIAANPDANWKIVTFHHSVYSTASHTTDGDILARRSTLPVVFSDCPWSSRIWTSTPSSWVTTTSTPAPTSWTEPRPSPRAACRTSSPIRPTARCSTSPPTPRLAPSTTTSRTTWRRASPPSRTSPSARTCPSPR